MGWVVPDGSKRLKNGMEIVKREIKILKRKKQMDALYLMVVKSLKNGMEMGNKNTLKSKWYG